MAQLSCLGGIGRATSQFSLTGFLVGRGWEASFVVGEVDSTLLSRPGSPRLQGQQNPLFEDPSPADAHAAAFRGQTVSPTWFCR